MLSRVSKPVAAHAARAFLENLVPREGLEPPRPKALVPKTSASAISPAGHMLKNLEDRAVVETAKSGVAIRRLLHFAIRSSGAHPRSRTEKKFLSLSQTGLPIPLDGQKRNFRGMNSYRVENSTSSGAGGINSMRDSCFGFYGNSSKKSTIEWKGSQNRTAVTGFRDPRLNLSANPL